MSSKWIPVPGYEDKYEICKSGKVRVKSRKISIAENSEMTLKPKELTTYRTFQDNKKYVRLSKNNKYEKVFIDDIVKEVFDGK